MSGIRERAGEVVRKRDLVARVWTDVTVDEGSLRSHLTALRKALGDGRPARDDIVNMPGAAILSWHRLVRSGGAP